MCLCVLVHIYMYITSIDCISVEQRFPKCVPRKGFREKILRVPPDVCDY
jgi:hypothetical protein